MPKQIITIEVEVDKPYTDNFGTPGTWNWHQIVNYYTERQWGFSCKTEKLQAGDPIQLPAEFEEEMRQRKAELKGKG